MSRKIKICLIDLEESSWFRRPAAALNLDDDRIECEYLYVISTPSDEIPIKKRKLRTIKLDAEYAIIFAYRIPELILIQSNPEVKFLYVQHGYYPDFLERTFSGVFKKLDRIIRYFYFIVIYLSQFREFLILRDILKVWTVKNFKATKLSAPAKSFVFDENWIDFHKTKLGWHNTEYKFLKFYEPKKIVQTKKFNLQYVAQTLVEDGRLQKDVLVDALNDYIKVNRIKDMCILAHPRTDETIYSDVNCNIEFEYRNCFDIKSIGHYSSLMLYLAENNVHVDIIGSDYIEIPGDFVASLQLAASGRVRCFTNDTTETYLNDEIN